MPQTMRDSLKTLPKGAARRDPNVTRSGSARVLRIAKLLILWSERRDSNPRPLVPQPFSADPRATRSSHSWRRNYRN
jgi:hypothetical protein